MDHQQALRFESISSRYFELEQPVFHFLTYMSGCAKRAERLLEEIMPTLLDGESHPERVAIFSSLLRMLPQGALRGTYSQDDGFMAACSRLPYEYRVIFVLHQVLGFSIREAGTVLGLSISDSIRVLHRARLLLRRDLQVHSEWVRAAQSEAVLEKIQ